MPATPSPLRWDIFCNVIDNFGDIGVCWRLARQLAAEHDFSVRLWVDDLTVFQHLCPEINPGNPQQTVLGVEVRHWAGSLSGEDSGDVVIEAFACQLPEQFEAAMAERRPRPVWINLDYLSAEDWVAGCHALPSPHSRLPLTKYFFFPGFTEKTGGLLRETNLESNRQAFVAAPAARSQLLDTMRIRLAPPQSVLVSLFSYESAALEDLLDVWSRGSRPVCCLAPSARRNPILERFAGHALQVGDAVKKGQLELHLVPFVPQTAYDPLLWLCDLNLVRGEDSFVRAQWAAKPMLWQIYPQEEKAHLAKLAAFLDLYCHDLTETEAETVKEFFLAWNGEGRITPTLWERWLDIFPQLQRHAYKWQKKLIKQQDLCNSLVQFCRSKL